jgi:hypothetical protein
MSSPLYHAQVLRQSLNQHLTMSMDETNPFISSVPQSELNSLT